ncbi:oligosaccharide flippase family protein [Epilithonimonas hominis]|uniref:oligosaccharide flippase family protein n=1 Tax=Epilithonimonas hominis TaxID=420404 RepID=UPI00289DEE52|nr:oligosaccharide flippase family protein [Epilithonimonas hominis]
MGSLSDFISNFFKNKGHFVFGSLLIAKICGFISSILIIRILPEKDFGLVSTIAALSAIFLAFSGFGSQQILLRYGSISKSVQSKKDLSSYLFRQGFICQILLSSIFLLTSIFYLERLEQMIWLFLSFSVRLIGYFFYNHIQSQLRIDGENREFAKLNNVVNISGLLLTIFLTYLFGIIGYLIASALTPFIALFWVGKVDLKKHFIIDWSKKELWKYGFFTAGTAVMSDALFSLDIILTGIFLSESYVADYKTAILIPSNLTFIALTFMQSDFPKLAKHYNDKKFLCYYISNYYKIFIPLCLFLLLAFFFLHDFVIRLFFGEKYIGIEVPFMILTAAFLLNMLFRNLYGNLLSAVGKMEYNTMVSLLGLAVLYLLSTFLVPKYGVAGMAVSQALTLFITGILLMVGFFAYFRKLF